MSDTMADTMGLEHVAASVRGDDSQKRKREIESADGRGNKRVSKADDHDPEALQDYANMHDHNGAGHDASSLAAAALAGNYPTMTVPQPTDVSFATQDSNPGDNSFMDSQVGGDSFMEQSTPSGRGSGNKPAVGSDEWHKVRKDNHKEGQSHCPLNLQVVLELMY